MKKTILKECKKHGLVEHVLFDDGTTRCKECAKDAVIDKRRRNKIKLVEYKGGKCEICGYDKCIDALEFHHLDPEEKEYGLSNGNTGSFEKMKSEADKCILVCANCHRELHAKQREKDRKEKEEKLLSRTNEFYQTHHGVRKDSRFIQAIFSSQDFKNDVSNKIPKKELAKKYNIGLTTIVRYLTANNLMYNEADKLNQYTVNSFIKDFKELVSFEAIGRRLGVTGNAIKKWCKNNGLPYKKKSLCDFIKTNYGGKN